MNEQPNSAPRRNKTENADAQGSEGDQRRTWSPPELIAYGDIAKITEGGGGEMIDPLGSGPG